MWVFTSNAFLSIVKPKKAGKALLVRSRFPGHIQRVFPGAAVLETPEADYRFRATIPRAQVMKALAVAVEEIGYPNFKDSIDGRAANYYAACVRVWAVMRFHQERENPWHPKARDGKFV